MTEPDCHDSPAVDSTKGSSPCLLVWLMVGGFVVWAAFGVIAYCCFACWQNRGLFGDMFGALNALFSAFAFAGVIYAIMLQREEMEHSRKELSAQSRMIAEQLRTSRDSLDFQKMKETLGSRPFLVPRGGGSSSVAKHGDFLNYGGPIREIEARIVDPQGVLKLMFQPDRMLNTDERGRWELSGFEGGRCPEVVLEITYTNRLSKRCRQKFRIPSGSVVEWILEGDEVELDKG